MLIVHMCNVISCLNILCYPIFKTPIFLLQVTERKIEEIKTIENLKQWMIQRSACTFLESEM